MADFLDFLQGKDNDGKLTEKIERAVEEAISVSEWKEEYEMTWTMKLNEEHEDGVIEGTIRTALSYGASESDVISRLMSDFHISEKDAEEALMEYKESFQLV